jgi:DNA polymerase
MTTYALDFESFYSGECSVSGLGPRAYFAHPEFDPYLVSVVGDNGYEFVGHPSEFDWALLDGAHIVSHNSSFDEHLYYYGTTRGWWPEYSPAQWDCTLDLCAYVGLPRSLAGAVNRVWPDEAATKATRDAMKGRRWDKMTPEFQAEVIEYARKDAKFCLRLWQEFSNKWPEFEREISRANRRIVMRGIPVNATKIQESIEHLAKLLHEAEGNIPWANSAKLLSRPAFNAACREHGLEPPKSLAMDDPEADAFMEKHGSTYLWMGAVRNWRRINALKKKLESFDAATMPDGRYYGGLLYFGAHTGRFSGSGGNLNLQNLTKDELFGVSLRPMIESAPGRTFLSVDLSQIEVRTLAWLAGDIEMLEAIRNSPDIYESFASRFGLWNGEPGTLEGSNPALRQNVKRIVLGCGFCMGSDRYAETTGVPREEAEEAVGLYRSSMELVVELWGTYKNAVRHAWQTGQRLRFRIPPGRIIDYGHVTRADQPDRYGRPQYLVMMQRKGSKLTPVRIHQGVIVENMAQALARNVFCDALLRLEAAGFQTILHIHDEVLIDINETEAEDALRHVVKIMSTPPDWLPYIPVAAKGKIMKSYTK